MARPESNTVDYFPHLISGGKKMYFIEHKYGNDGYATWYKILETLGATEYHYLNLNQQSEVMFLSAKCRVSEPLLLGIISDLAEMGIFNKQLWENKIIWCEKFVQSISVVYVRRNNKCMQLDSLCAHLQSKGILKPSFCIVQGNDNPQSKVKYSKVDILFESTEPIANRIVDSDFDKFWDLYGKKINRDRVEKKWLSLKQKDRDAILIHVPKYVQSTPELKYRKHPLTYLNNKSWLDEIIITINSKEKRGVVTDMEEIKRLMAE